MTKRGCIAGHFIGYVLIVLICREAMPQNAAAQYIPQQITIGSSPNPVGSGARAVGMGGAFIAVADDATAASWNPGGLSQLKRPEISFALSLFSRREEYTSRQHPEINGMQKTLTRELNYMSMAYPFELFQRNMIVSLNYQRLYEFDREIQTDFFTKSFSYATKSFTRILQKIDFDQEGALKAISPAFAIEITSSFSFGMTFNFWTDHLFWSNGWTSNTVVKGHISNPNVSPVKFISKEHDRYHDFTGFNMHIGFLWRPNSRITLGAVVKTPFTASIKHDQTIRTTMKYANGTVTSGKVRIKENVDLDMPISYGLGVAIRFSDTFTMALDIYRTEWSQFILEDGNGTRVSPITGESSHQSHIHATHQVRLGAEYLFILTKTIIPLRCGLFYDPEPSRKNPEDFWGFSIGTGITIKNAVFDFAYQFRFGNNVEGEVLDLPTADADVTQHLFMASVILYF